VASSETSAFRAYTHPHGGRALRRPHGISSVPSRLLPLVPSLQTPGAATASRAHASTAAAAFVGLKSTRPPQSRTLPAISVRSPLTTPNAFPFGAAREFARGPRLGAGATCRVCFDGRGRPLTPDPWLPGSCAFARRRTSHLLGRRGSRPAIEAMDPLEWRARMVDHIPDPGKHRTLRYGVYSNRARGAGEPKQPGEETAPKRRRCTASWARLITRSTAPTP